MKKKFRPYYWAATFDKDIIDGLLREFKHIIDPYDNKKDEYHLTYKYFKKEEDDYVWKDAEGTEQEFIINRFCYNDKICGFFIDNTMLPCDNKHPHISVAKMEENKWVETGSVPDNEHGVIEMNVTIKGTVKRCN